MRKNKLALYSPLFGGHFKLPWWAKYVTMDASTKWTVHELLPEHDPRPHRILTPQWVSGGNFGPMRGPKMEGWSRQLYKVVDPGDTHESDVYSCFIGKEQPIIEEVPHWVKYIAQNTGGDWSGFYWSPRYLIGRWSDGTDISVFLGTSKCMRASRYQKFKVKAPYGCLTLEKMK